MKRNKAILIFGAFLLLFVALSNAFAFGVNPFSNGNSSTNDSSNSLKFNYSIGSYKPDTVIVPNTSGIHSGTAIGFIGKKAISGFASTFEGFGTLMDVTSAKIKGNNDYAAYRAQISIVDEWREKFTKKYNPGGAVSFIGDAFEGIGQSSVYIPCAFVLLYGMGLSFTNIFKRLRSNAESDSEDEESTANWQSNEEKEQCEQEKLDKRFRQVAVGTSVCAILIILVILIICYTMS